MVFARLNITPSALPMLSILSSIKNARTNGLDISPDYQRGYIWTDQYKDQLIFSIILNYPIGNIVINNLNEPNTKNARQELVDGKQRLTTILRFVECGNVEQYIDGNDRWFKLSSKISDQAKGIIKGIVGDSDPAGIAKMERARRLSYKDLPASIQMNINAYSIPVYTMQAADPAQIRDYFKVLQNQEKLRAGEIINSLPDNPMSVYFSGLPAQRFLENVNCQSFKRAELEKIYYSVLGMWFDKIQLNSADQKVIDFVANADGLSDEQIQVINNLDQGIVQIAEMPTAIQKTRISKRMVKLLFGMALHSPGYFSVNALSRAQQLCDLSAKLAAFNSSESDPVSFAKYFSDEYTSNEEDFLKRRAPLYRTLFWSTARSVSKTEFVRAMEIIKLLFTESFDSAFEYYRNGIHA
jgi:hypothetical protein